MMYGRVALALAAFLALGAAQASAGCSNASLKGAYGVLITGQNAAKMPVAGLYLLKADGAGNATGTGMQDEGNGLVAATISATYTVTPACTGMMQTASGDTLDFVLDNANANFQLIQAASGDGVTTGEGFRQGAAGCRLSALKETFGYGGILPPDAQTSVVGEVTFDGKGGGTGGSTLVSGGLVLTGTGKVTYSAGPGCFFLATVTTTVSEGGSVILTDISPFAFLLVNDGKQMLYIGGKAGSVSGGRMLK